MNRTRSRAWGGCLAALLVATALQVVAVAPARADAGSPCGATVNPIVCENRQPGTPESVWDDTDGAGDDSIQGFTTDVSANVGGRVDFKISTPARSYRIEIYRLGYYQGNGARLMSTITPSAALAQNQPTCASDPSTQLLDCGNWAVSASWNVPTTAVSGIYVADLRRTDNNTDNSQIPFVVRDDSSRSDVLFQTSDATWQAYNTYGGSDFYTGNQQLTDSQARAFKVSYNRPYSTRGDNDGRDYLFSNEFPTLRFLERNGYDVSYSTDVDTDRFGSLLTNHKVFLSVGHDEYWSQQQRDNVVAARDRGVDLMFLSGNEMYWRTRYEPSIDGSSTAYRTIACYKETWDEAPTDPVDGSTSTFRDPRFKTGALGGNPENAVTGTLFMANQDDLAISVSGAEGKLRLWRNTTLGAVADTTVTKLAAHTIGYESDEDLDNGARPAGLVDLSTTVGTTPMKLQDFGLQTAAGTTTHHLTLYRAASGALVFGAGTIQWGWGLDADHDGFAHLAADTRIQQATINMLADMRVLATTVQSGLVAATTSTDTTAPAVTVTSPTAGSTIANGTVLTVTGTASDTGGAVAGVEVSLDGGGTWHPATGRTSWTYTGVLHGTGSTAVLVRATDDSANTSAPTSVAVTVTCPCTIFGASAPAKADGGDTTAVTLGTRFTSDTDAYATGIRFYKASTNTGSHIGTLWSAAGTVLARGSFAGESASGWQTLTFSTPVALTANTTYVAGYYAPKGHYSATTNMFLYRDLNATPLHAAPYSPGVDQVAGVYSTGNAFPIASYQASGYWVDPVLSTTNPLPPTVTSVTPRAGATGATGKTVSASFGGPVAPVSVSFAVTGNGAAVTGTTSYDPASYTATYTLPADFTAGALYTVSVTATGANGVPMGQPFQWSFRATGTTDGSCPCSLYPDSAVPTTAEDPDTDGVELGVAFTADTDGVVTGVEFYKSPGNIGTHTATLWSASGTALATATFAQETPSGWQYAAFSSPVPVTADTTYVASYHAPNGHYSSTAGDYTSGRDAFPLHVPARGARYTYGTGAPTTTSTASYGVDVDFTVSAATVPSVTAVSPAAGATSVATGTPVTATYDNSVTTGSVTVAVTAPGGATVPGATTLDVSHHVVTFTPSTGWTAGATYQVSVTGGRSLGGTVQSTARTWSFSTGSGSVAPPNGTGLFATNAVPATIDSGDAGAVSLGMRFSSSTAGTVTGVRFYKASANTGTHTVSLWSATGTRLATARPSGESTSGWQYAAFASPVAITAGTTYVVSYYAPKGHYSVDANAFNRAATNGPLTAPAGSNGVYVYGSDAFPTSSYAASNYWVDPYVVAGSGAPVSVASQSPAAGSSSVAATAVPSTTYSADLSAPSVQATVTQRIGTGAATAVSGTVAYAAATRTVTFTPGTAFAAGATVSVSVTAVLADGTTAAPTSAWSYTVAKADPTPGVCPCTLRGDGAVPGTVTVDDAGAVELGTAFTADTAGSVTGVSFYKGPANTGTHTVYLYDAGGARLATATVTNETTTGWQTASFANPVTITPGATYVVSYYAPVGYYSATTNGWSAGLDAAPLHVAAGASGRYVYRAASSAAAPTTTSSADYAVQPVFTTGS